MQCHENTFAYAHTVPVSNLITVNTAAILVIGYLIGHWFGLGLVGLLLIALVCIAGDAVFHWLAGIPNNVSYFFGLGPRPGNWVDVCPQVPAPVMPMPPMPAPAQKS